MGPGERWSASLSYLLLLPGRAWVKRLIIILPIKRTIFHFRRRCTPKCLVRFQNGTTKIIPSELLKTLSTSINAARKNMTACACNINANVNDINARKRLNVKINYNTLLKIF